MQQETQFDLIVVGGGTAGAFSAIAAARDLPLEKFITHTFPLEQLQQALDTALDPASNSIKVIVKP